MYICKYMHINIYLYTYNYIYTYIYTHTYMHIHAYFYIKKYIYTQIFIHKSYTQIYIHTHTHTDMYTHIFLSGRSQCVKIRGAVYSLLAVTSGVIQGSALGPLLFTVYMNPLLVELGDISVAFANDLKFRTKVASNQSVITQAAINKLVHWSESFFMPLSLEKCIVLHCGKNNLCFTYTCGVHQLSSVDELVDLGVVCSNSSAVSYSSSVVNSKANKVAGLILRTFHTRDTSVLWRAFSIYVSPILMYTSQCWSPKLCRDMVVCENVQRRFSKRLFGVHGLSYIERLQQSACFISRNIMSNRRRFVCMSNYSRYLCSFH